jgi:hypothetical protein
MALELPEQLGALLKGAARQEMAALEEALTFLTKGHEDYCPVVGAQNVVKGAWLAW